MTTAASCHPSEHSLTGLQYLKKASAHFSGRVHRLEDWRLPKPRQVGTSRTAANTRSRIVPSNSPRAIEILLHIIHLNTRQIPRARDINLEELFHVAVAVDMYDLGECLGLWAKNWCNAVALMVNTTTDVESLTQLSWIGWVFGDILLFEHALNQLVVEVEVDGRGELVDAGGMELGDIDYLKAMDLLGEYWRAFHSCCFCGTSVEEVPPLRHADHRQNT